MDIKLLGYLSSFTKKFSRENLYTFLEESIKEYILVQNRKKLKIVNIGAGGEISYHIRKYIEGKSHIEFIEIDIDKKRHPDYVLDVQNMYLIKDEEVDVVFCLEVLEHVQNPFKAVSEIYRILKPGGLIIGSVPFIFPIHDEPHDYFRFTRYGISYLFRNFKCLKLVERNSYIKSWYVILLRLINTESFKERIIGVMLFPFMVLILPIVITLDMVVKNNHSTTGYFFIYKK